MNLRFSHSRIESFTIKKKQPTLPILYILFLIQNVFKFLYCNALQLFRITRHRPRNRNLFSRYGINGSTAKVLAYLLEFYVNFAVFR
ncbi:hypothetical protein TH25_06130 [Thalassospira profundimaris]|uniref:Uncharacterized protein n=1 Tax=Thalassospira profundimaris TaxID=502049 RepID=A0A367XGR6_9PROT|nr:hypothetical protein TH25_06130 [Thalassospira profundimaris]